MKTIFTISLLLASHSVFASDFEQTCLNRYRDATLSMIDSAKAFNDQSLSNAEFLADFAKTETIIGATRVVCSFESAKTKNCVRLYKKQYHKIRDNIDIVQIAEGNQTRVKLGLVEAGLAVVDLRCQ